MAAGDIDAPSSLLSIQQVALVQAGAASDGSQDQILGTVSASTASSGNAAAVNLQAADGSSGAPGGDCDSMMHCKSSTSAHAGFYAQTFLRAAVSCKKLITLCHRKR